MMKIAAIPENEELRLNALRDLAVLDTGPEAEFEALVNAASLVCEAPISLISLVDQERQWFKANIGLPGVSETPRDIAFCSHTILGEDLFDVQDAILDERFADNPLVAGQPNIRFYAGAPLIVENGQRVGTLFVIDQVPKVLSANQRAILMHLARAAAKALDGRRATRQLHQARMAAFEIEQRFRQLSESAMHGVYYANAQGACLYANECWQELYDLDEVQCLGDGWLRSIHPNDYALVLEQWKNTAARGQNFDMEFRLLRPDGKERIVHSRARPLFDERGDVTGFVGSAEDLTERAKKRDALRKSEGFLHRTGKLVGVGGWELDFATNKIYWSDETCRLHGIAAGFEPNLEDLIGFFVPHEREKIREVIKRSLSDCESWDLELELLRADRRHIWVRTVGSVDFVEGKPLRIVGVYQDVTEMVMQRKAAQDDKEIIKLAADSGGIGVWDWNVITNAIVWDEWLFRLYGHVPRAEDVVYDIWANALHPDDRARAENDIQDALKAIKPFNTEFRVVWPDGSIHHIRGSGTVTRNSQGEPIRMIGVNWDVSKERELAQQIRDQHEQLRVTMRSIGDSVITTNAKGLIEWLNPVAERMTGWTAEEAKGRPLDQVFHALHAESRIRVENVAESCIKRQQVVGLANQTILISRQGDEYGIEDSAAPIRNDRDEIIGVVVVFHDVTEQRRLSGEMSYRATHDALTGLVNRMEFEIRLRKLLGFAQNDQSEHALLFIDLDQFKLVNDACGHAVGDQLLQQVSKLLASAIRSRDTLARLGGDEFAIILEQCSAEQAARIAQQICDRMEDFRFMHEEKRFRVGTSIGLVPVDARWNSTEAIMQAADTSCYAAKEAGRNRVHAWFDTDIAMRARHGEMQWTTRIEHALEDNRFVLYAQRIWPIDSIAKGLHAEVLLRMLDADGSLIPPGAFLPAAERFNLVSRIDRWVLKHTVDWIAALPDRDILERLSMNLSGRSVGDRAFHRWAIETLNQADPAICHKLCLEITETAAVTNLADAALFIEQLRAIGICVALDDFGAGASSFGYLKTMKVDCLKIDGQFVQNINTDPLDEAAVRCFADVAKVIGVVTVAEYVDQASILEKLKLMGIDYAQGFLLHRPAPIDELLM